MKNNSFRDGMIHVKRQMCSTCIFRPGNKMHLEDGRAKEMAEHAKRNESAVICHDTLRTKANAVCRGFYNNHSTLPLRLAKVCGNIKEV